jgi:hypothetical protein
MAGGRFDNQFQSAMTSVASLLGTTVSALQTSTQSLAQLAASKGISMSQLTDAIKSGMQSAGTQLSGARLDNIANRIATRRPHHHHHHGAPSPDQAGTSNAAIAAAGTAAGASTGISVMM